MDRNKCPCEFPCDYPEKGIHISEADFQELLDCVHDGERIMEFPVLEHINYLGQLAWSPKFSATEPWKYSTSKSHSNICKDFWFLCHAHKMLRVCQILKNNNMEEIKKIYWEMEEGEADVKDAPLYYRSIILGEEIDWCKEL